MTKTSAIRSRKSLTVFFAAFVMALHVAFCIAAEEQGKALMNFGDVWKYNDSGANLGSAWRDADFDDSAWKEGAGELGYGDGDEKTVISYGPNPKNKRVTYYFRKTFEVRALPKKSELSIRTRFDDGFAAYLNGTPLASANLPKKPKFDTLASRGQEGNVVIDFESLNASALKIGLNTIAVEVHQGSRTSSDISFDMELRLGTKVNRFHILPYVQNTTPNGVTVMWETDEPYPSEVDYCEVSEQPRHDLKAKDATEVTIHKVIITGLKPDTLYSYRVRYKELSHTADFSTAPATNRPIRFAVLGDSRFWRSYWETTGFPLQMMSRKPEFTIHMGDLVPDGRVYKLWRDHFRRFGYSQSRIPMFPVRGNHERDGSSDPANNWFSRYFELPGGEPYTSFDWGNSHFTIISFVAFSGRKLRETLAFLDKDLGATDKKWKFVACHYPVYCTGYHSPTDKRKARGKPPIEAILDKHNVDVVLNGHTHIYERSFPFRGGKRDDRNGALYLVQGGSVGGHYPERWTAIIARDMDMPHYSFFTVDDDKLELRSYGLAKGSRGKGKAAKIIEIDRYIRWRDEKLPKQLMAQLSEKDGDELREIIEQLGAMIYQPAAPEIVKYLNAKDESLRHTAALAIERIASAEIAPRLIPYLKHEDAAVRRRVARSLEAGMPTELAEQIEPHIFDESQDAVVRTRLLGAILLHAPERAYRVGVEMLAAKDDAIRDRAADLVKRAAAKKDVPALVKLFENEPRGYVTLCLAWGLNRITGKRTDMKEIGKSKPGERGELAKVWLGN